MANYEKHRLGVEDFQIEQADQLGSGEALTGNPTVTVTIWDSTLGKWVATGTEFPITGEAISGTKSIFKIGAAPTNADQARGLYRVNVVQTTNGTESLHSEVTMYIRDYGDINAPAPTP